MRFSVFLAGAMAVFANAQASEETTAVATSVPAPTAATPTYALSPEQSSQLACVEACDAGDVDCQSHCVPVPSPNDAQVNATNECAANCDQGDGSEADTIAYGECIQQCIKTHYYETSKGTPNPTGGSGSGSDSNGSKTGSGSSATGTGSSDSEDDSGSDSTATGTGKSSGTATGSSAAATSTNAAAVPVAVGSATLFGFVAALLAL